MDTKKVGEQISTLRKGKRLTQSDLGRKVRCIFSGCEQVGTW
jgi:hypothetical protein